MANPFVNWTDADILAHQSRIKHKQVIASYQAPEKAARSKYGNQKAVIDGIKFDSRREGKRYVELKLLENQGIIHCLKLQVPFELAPAVIINGRKKPPLRYVADFMYFLADDLKYTIEDVKGVKTALYICKRHLMKSVHNIDIVEI